MSSPLLDEDRSIEDLTAEVEQIADRLRHDPTIMLAVETRAELYERAVILTRLARSKYKDAHARISKAYETSKTTKL